jgi:D-sedoheptulose 7-phosphate isomerase
VRYGAMTAKKLGMQVISLTGKKESPLSVLADAAIRVPVQETYMVQELHLPVYHWLCAMLEEEFFE